MLSVGTDMATQEALGIANGCVSGTAILDNNILIPQDSAIQQMGK